MVRHDTRGFFPLLWISLFFVLVTAAMVQAQSAATDKPVVVSGAPAPPSPILHKIAAANERLEMTVTTSRILTLEQKIPQAQVNNPDLLELTPLSPNQIQIFAKKPGVTQVNLWDENNRVFTVDVIVFADARELEMLLKSEFPTAAITVRPVSQGVLISGYVDNPQHVSRIIQLAEEYYPKVINNITIGGVQKVVLHAKVMEISRTKLRSMGIDFGNLNGNDLVASSVSGLLATGASAASGGSMATNGGQTFVFNVLDGANSFIGVLKLLRQQNLVRVLAEPDLVAISGRPASFVVGGEIPVLVPQSLGTVSIDWKKWGTQIDFVPIVLGNGQIRLEVRPRVSDIDTSRSVKINSYDVPGLWVREVETGVEMKAGQTLAIAGLVQDRTESINGGLPWVSDMPYVGALFRSVQEKRNEIELLILVTPELIEAMDPQDVPPCGPGTLTDSPSDHQLYWKGHLEVPACCGVCGGAGCAACGGSAGGPGAGSAQPAQGPQPAPAPDAAASSARRPQRTAAVPAASNSYNRANRQNASQPAAPARSRGELPGFLGPVGYDAVR